MTEPRIYREGDIGKVLEERTVICPFQSHAGYGLFKMSLLVSPNPDGFGPPLPVPQYRFIKKATEAQYLNQNDFYGDEPALKKDTDGSTG